MGGQTALVEAIIDIPAATIAQYEVTSKAEPTSAKPEPKHEQKLEQEYEPPLIGTTVTKAEEQRQDAGTQGEGSDSQGAGGTKLESEQQGSPPPHERVEDDEDPRMLFNGADD